MKTFILDSNLTVHDLQEAIKKLPVNHLNPKWAVTIEEAKRVRSRQQNSLYWVVLSHIAQCKPKGVVTVPEAWHRYFGGMFLEKNEIFCPDTGKYEMITKSTTKMPPKKFNKYLEEIEEHCFHEFGILLPERE